MDGAFGYRVWLCYFSFVACYATFGCGWCGWCCWCGEVVITATELKNCITDIIGGKSVKFLPDFWHVPLDTSGILCYTCSR